MGSVFTGVVGNVNTPGQSVNPNEPDGDDPHNGNHTVDPITSIENVSRSSKGTRDIADVMHTPSMSGQSTTRRGSTSMNGADAPIGD